MANTIVLSAEQQTPFRAHSVVKDDYGTIEQSWTEVEPKTGDGKVPVALPDMFVRFLSGPPRVNPHYARVKAESEDWFAEKCQLNARWTRILRKTDFSYFCAITAADAGPEELRTLCDWGNWVFPFDDLFDNGYLKDNPAMAQSLVDVVLSDMGVRPQNDIKGGRESLPAEQLALVDVHKAVWNRIAKSSSKGTYHKRVQQRFVRRMYEYCKGSMEQVKWRSQRQIPSIEDSLATRRKSAGVAPLYALAEYALKLNLPNCVFESESIQEIERIGIDFVVIQNDILSYCKEETEGILHNIVAIMRYHMESLYGPSAPPHPQMAFDSVGKLLEDLYRRWYMALANLPSWGEKIDAEVQQYIDSVRAVVMANLNWSFRSERYFGPDVDKVRSTRVVQVLRRLPEAEFSF